MKKIVIALGAALLMMVALPLYVELFESPAGKEGWYFTLFLMLNPIFVGLLGIFAGTDVKRLWFTPFVTVVLFPLGFWLARWEMDTDLLVYTPIYFGIGLITMFITHLITDRVRQK